MQPEVLPLLVAVDAHGDVDTRDLHRHATARAELGAHA